MALHGTNVIPLQRADNTRQAGRHGPPRAFCSRPGWHATGFDANSPGAHDHDRCSSIVAGWRVGDLRGRDIAKYWQADRERSVSDARVPWPTCAKRRRCGWRRWRSTDLAASTPGRRRELHAHRLPGPGLQVAAQRQLFRGEAWEAERVAGGAHAVDGGAGHNAWRLPHTADCGGLVAGGLDHRCSGCWRRSCARGCAKGGGECARRHATCDDYYPACGLGVQGPPHWRRPR